jgi:hypothetical protein
MEVGTRRVTAAQTETVPPGRRAKLLEAGRWADVEVQGCELSATALEDTNLFRVVFRSCRMSGLTAIRVKAKDVRFVGQLRQKLE